jgi:hypothetical protein
LIGRLLQAAPRRPQVARGIRDLTGGVPWQRACIRLEIPAGLRRAAGSLSERRARLPAQFSGLRQLAPFNPADRSAHG